MRLWKKKLRNFVSKFVFIQLTQVFLFKYWILVQTTPRSLFPIFYRKLQIVRNFWRYCPLDSKRLNFFSNKLNLILSFQLRFLWIVPFKLPQISVNLLNKHQFRQRKASKNSPTCFKSVDHTIYEKSLMQNQNLSFILSPRISIIVKFEMP